MANEGTVDITKAADTPVTIVQAASITIVNVILTDTFEQDSDNDLMPKLDQQYG